MKWFSKKTGSKTPPQPEQVVIYRRTDVPMSIGEEMDIMMILSEARQHHSCAGVIRPRGQYICERHYNLLDKNLQQYFYPEDFVANFS